MLRILDANLNRVGEGLRVLEDVSRFILNDPGLSEELKVLRHRLLPRDRSLQERLLSARRAGEDVGAFIGEESEAERPDTLSLVRANSRRVQQSLRVIEEITKVPGQDFGLDWKKVKEARFKLYELEQTVLLRLSRRDRCSRIAGLYLIIDVELLHGRAEAEVAQAAIRGGASVIQLRDKMRPKRDVVPAAQRLKSVCSEAGALFIMNDYLDVALASDADGLHVGRDDLPVPSARKLLTVDRLVGCSAATVEEAIQAEEQGADYVAVGAMYPTPTKPGTRIAGLDVLRQVKAKVSVPVVAIGGINEHNVAGVMGAGADAVAVISAVLNATDVEEASRRLAARIGGGQK